MYKYYFRKVIWTAFWGNCPPPPNNWKCVSILVGSFVPPGPKGPRYLSCVFVMGGDGVSVQVLARASGLRNAVPVSVKASDLRGRSVAELRVGWPHLFQTEDMCALARFVVMLRRTKVVDGVAGLLNRVARTPPRAVVPNALPRGVVGETGAVPVVRPPRTGSTVDMWRRALQRVAEFRLNGVRPDTQALCVTIECLQKAPDNVLTRALPDLPRLPRQRAAYMRRQPSTLATVEYADIWLEFCNWKKSAGQYITALRLWAQACTLTTHPINPAAEAALAVFISWVPNPRTLRLYLSHLRSVWTWLRWPLGAFACAVTKGLVGGAAKIMDPRAERVKKAVSPFQMSQLVALWRRQGKTDLCDSMIIARHFAMRYKSEALQMRPAADGFGSIVLRLRKQELWADVRVRRKPTGPVLQLISRKCICSQSTALCGVHVLQRRVRAVASGHRPLFAGVSYSLARAELKTAARVLGWDQPEAWGTQALRRGYGRDCFLSGGLASMLQQGSWRGAAAFAYLSAQQLASIETCDVVLDFSDSDDE